MIPVSIAKTLLAPETTPGTAVAPNKRLLGLSMDFSPKEKTGRFRPAGLKLDASVYHLQSATDVSLEGILCANALAYVLSSAIARATPNQIMDGTTATGAYRWVFTLSPDNLSKQTYTFGLDWGSGAYRAAYGLIREFSLELGDEPKLSAKGVARGLSAASSVASVTEISPIPLGPSFAVYLDSTASGIGTTAVANVIAVSVSLSDLAAPVFTGGQEEYSAHIETAPDFAISVTVLGDISTHLGAIRSSTVQYLRLSVGGPRLYTGETNVDASLIVDCPVEVEEIGKLEDEDGVYASEITFRAVYDSSLSPTFTVINELGAL